jgi:aspartate ammonia-lyase
MGRTELQDAVPMTVGQEFHAFGASLDAEIRSSGWKSTVRAEHGRHRNRLGYTPGGYDKAVARAGTPSKPWWPQATCCGDQEQRGFVVYSSALKHGHQTVQIASDLILLASGPRGINEIDLPALRLGSSIMPGKVNPVMPELMDVIAFRVSATTGVDIAAHASQLQLNAYEPLEGCP